MKDIKCPCGMRDYMEEEDCSKASCNDCCPLADAACNEEVESNLKKEACRLFDMGRCDCEKTLCAECCPVACDLCVKSMSVAFDRLTNEEKYALARACIGGDRT